MVNTAKVTDRRELHFSTMADILADADYLACGDPPRVTGNWTPGQIVAHVSAVIRCSFDGFPVPKASLAMRILGRLIKNMALNKPMRAGLKVPKEFATMIPGADTPWDEAVDELRTQIGRLDTQRMTIPSPVLGKLSHEDWKKLHCRHAEMHFSFLQPS